MPAGDAAQVTFQATIKEGTPYEIISNTASVICDQIALPFLSNMANVIVVAPLLSLAKTASQYQVQSGDTVTYTVLCTNNGNASATKVILTDALPAQLAFVAGSATAGGSFDATDSTLTWVLGNLPAYGGSALVRFQATVKSGLPSGTYILNTASAVFDETTMPVASNAAAIVIPTKDDWWMFHHDPQHTGRSPYTGPSVPRLKWKYATEGWVDSSPAIGTDGNIYVGSDDGNLYALNPSYGTVNWQDSTDGSIESSPAIGTDGTVYVGSEEGNLYALNPSDGTVKWQYPTEWPIDSSPAIGSDGSIYFGSYSYFNYYNNYYYLGYCLCALNTDGTPNWNFFTNGPVESSRQLARTGPFMSGAMTGISTQSTRMARGNGVISRMVWSFPLQPSAWMGPSTSGPMTGTFTR